MSQQVFSAIAAMAAAQVPYVARLGATLKEAAAARIGIRPIDMGANTEIHQSDVEVTVRLVVYYGCRIPDLALQVQEKVKDDIEAMTKCRVSAVNVIVQDIDFSRHKGKEG